MISEKKKRKKYGLMSLVMILVLAGIIMTSLAFADEADITEDISTLNVNHSQILVKGEGYHLNYEQEVQREKEQEQQKIKEEDFKQKTEASVNINDNGGEIWDDLAPDNNKKKEDGEDKNEESDEDINTEKSPMITTSLSNIKQSEVVSGTWKHFTVSAKDYKGSKIGLFFIEVYGNGSRVYSSSEDGYRGNYTMDLQDGVNTVRIKVKDKEGNVGVKTIDFTADINGQQKSGGTAKFSLDARNLGLGYIIPSSRFEFYEGEKLSAAICRFLTSYGFSYSYAGSINEGFYIKSVSKPGMVQDPKIPDNILEGLESIGASETAGPFDHDKLGEFDFYGKSGWMYEYNGEIRDTGLSNVIVKDGDKINIWFTTHLGVDRGGVWDPSKIIQ